jgi:hypothetical protein
MTIAAGTKLGTYEVVALAPDKSGSRKCAYPELSRIRFLGRSAGL